MKIQALLVAMVLFVSSSAFAADQMSEGLWEIKTTISIPNMPVNIPPQTIKHCYTKEDVKDKKNVVATQNKDCTVKDMKMSGNKMTWEMVCTGAQKGTFSGETIFAKDSYNSKMKMVSGGQTTDMKIAAKRLGECP